MVKKQKGFTIVELVIVIAVIGVLTAILVPTFTSLSNKAREAATQSNLTNAYKSYQVEALSSAGSIKYLEKEEIYFSNEKNSTIAKEDVYHFVDGKWKKARAEDIYQLNTVYDGFDYQAAKFSGFYGFTAIEKLESLSIINPNGSNTVERYVSVALVAQPEPAGASSEVTWTTTDEEKVSVSSSGVINTCGEVGQSATITATSVIDPSKSASITITIGAAPSVSAEEVKSIELPQFVSEYNANSSNLDNPDANNAAMAHAKGPNIRSAIRRGVFYANDEGKRDNYMVGVRNTFRFPYLSRTTSSMSGQGVAYCGPFLNYEITERNGAGEFVSTDKVTTDGYNINFSSAYLAGGTFGDVFKLRIFNSRINYEFIFETFDGYNIYKPEELSLLDNRDLTAGRLKFQDGSQTTTNGDKITSAWLLGVDYWQNSRNGISSDDVKGIALHNNMVIKNRMIPDGLKYTKEDVETYISTFGTDFKAWSKLRNDHYNDVYGDYTFDGKSELIGSLRDDTALFYRTTNGEEFRFEGNYFTVDASELKPTYALRTSNNPDPLLTGNLAEKWAAESHLAFFGANLTNNNDTADNAGGELSENSVMQYKEGSYKFKKPTRGGEIILNNTAFVGNGDLSNDERYGGGLIMFKSSAVTMTFNNDIVYKSYMGFMPQPCWYIVSDEVNQVNGISDYHAWDTKFILNRVKCYRSYNIMFSAYGTTGNELNKCYFEDAGGPLLMVDELNYGKHNNTGYGAVDKAYYHTASIDIVDSYLRNYVQGTESWFVQYPLAGTMLGMIKTFGVDGGFLNKDSRDHGEHKNIIKMQSGVPVLNFIGLDVSTSANIVENFKDTNPNNSKITSGDQLEGHIRITNTSTSNVFALDMTYVNTHADIIAYNAVTSANNQQTMIIETAGGGHGLLCDGSGRNAAVYVEGLGEYVVDYLLAFNPSLDAETQTTIASALNNNDKLKMFKYYGSVVEEGEDLNVEFFIPEQMFNDTPLESLKTYVAAGITSYLNVKRDNLASGDFASIYVNLAPAATHYFGVLFGLM